MEEKEESLGKEAEISEQKETETFDEANLLSQINDLNDRILRLLAENENTRIRHERLVKEAKDYSVGSFAKDLLGVMDNLARALEFLEKKDLSEELKGLAAGVILTKKELESVFNKYGLEAINPGKGEKFDHDLHQAVSKISTDEYESGTIVESMQAGYKLKDRLIRPAMVIVSEPKG